MDVVCKEKKPLNEFSSNCIDQPFFLFSYSCQYNTYLYTQALLIAWNWVFAALFQI